MMWTDIAPTWPSHVPSLLTRFPALPEDDALATDGNRDRLATLLADTQGTTAENARIDLDDWITGQEPVDAVMDETRDNARITASGRDIPAGEDPSDDDARFGDDALAEAPVGRT